MAIHRDIKFWMASGDKLKNVMNTATRIHLVRDIHMNHMIAFGEDYGNRILSIKREIDENPKRLHFLIAEGGVIGKRCV